MPAPLWNELSHVARTHRQSLPFQGQRDLWCTALRLRLGPGPLIISCTATAVITGSLAHQ